MPIYAYKCASCGHSMDKLQKMSDDPLTVCPVCGDAALVKQVTAAGFQLKGSGWYATDFKGNGSKAAAGPNTGAKAEAQGEGSAEVKSESKPENKPEQKSENKSATKTETPAAATSGSSSASL